MSEPLPRYDEWKTKAPEDEAEERERTQRRSPVGEIADDMIDGTTCQLCGCFFGGLAEDECYTHGYPVVCWDCWEYLPKKQRKKYQRAERPTL